MGQHRSGRIRTDQDESGQDRTGQGEMKIKTRRKLWDVWFWMLMCDFIRICSPYAAMHDTCLFLLFFTLTAPYKMFANQEIEFRKSVLINFRLIILFSRCLFAYTSFDSLSTRLPLTHHSFTAHSLLTHQLLTTYSLFTHHLLTNYLPLIQLWRLSAVVGGWGKAGNKAKAHLQLGLLAA